jgi:hypothetical protein
VKYTTTDGLITVNAPEPPDWSLESIAGASQAETRTTMIKCKRATPGPLFFLLAKDYTVSPQHVVTADALLREVYPRSYAKLFETVTLEALHEKTVQGRSWWEANYQLVHAKLGAITKIERATCVADHVLLVSGEGQQDEVARQLGMLASWMDTASFATLSSPR